jgi:hypothetical protein
VIARRLVLAVLLCSGCCTCQRQAAQIAREIESVLVRTEPNWRLDARQQAKLLRDEEILKADIAALASGR